MIDRCNLLVTGLAFVWAGTCYNALLHWAFAPLTPNDVISPKDGSTTIPDVLASLLIVGRKWRTFHLSFSRLAFLLKKMVGKIGLLYFTTQRYSVHLVLAAQIFVHSLWPKLISQQKCHKDKPWWKNFSGQLSFLGFQRWKI